MIYAIGGLVWGQMRGMFRYYLKSGGLHPLGGLYNILGWSSFGSWSEFISRSVRA